MMHLYFCRHAQSLLGQQGLWAGSTDTPLSDEGHEQAKAAGHDAQKLNIDYILSSPLSRAYDTAKIIASEIGYPEDKIEVNPLIIERHLGSLEGKLWDPDLNFDSVDDVEPWEIVLDRARQTAEHLQTIESENILVVSHGSFGRALRSVLHPEIKFDKNDRFENAKIVQLL